MIWLTLILVIPYFVIILAIYKGLKRLEPFEPEKPSSKFVSVLIPCYNEQENLPYILSDLAAQHYSNNLFEIIIIDDNSDDNTYNVASSFSTMQNLRIIKNNGYGKKNAIKTGINAAKSDFIITTDADCRIGKEWLSSIMSFSDVVMADLIICPVALMPQKGFFGKFCELEFLSLQGITAGSVFIGGGSMCNGANLAFRKQTWIDNEQNLHPEIASGDDVFLLHSIKKKKKSSAVWLESQKALVTTKIELSVNKFLKQRSRWLSKARVYDDTFTIALGAITFVTVLFQAITLAAAFFYQPFLYLYIMITVLKSIPDYLILNNVTKRYDRLQLMRWFLPSQIIYPFYVIAVTIKAFIVPNKRG